MSGSREARQLVFCHACENEFYKTSDDLTCPECGQNFTELVCLTPWPVSRRARDVLDGLRYTRLQELSGDEDDVDDVIHRMASLSLDGEHRRSRSSPVPGEVGNSTMRSASSRLASQTLALIDQLTTTRGPERAVHMRRPLPPPAIPNVFSTEPHYIPQMPSSHIPNTFDPRSTEREFPTGFHEAATSNDGIRYPWDEADDPDEADIDEFRREPGSSYRDRRGQQAGNQRGDGSPYLRDDPFGNSFRHPIMPEFGHMFNHIVGMPSNTPWNNFTGPQGQREQQGGMPGSWPPQEGRQERTEPRVFTRNFRNGGIQMTFQSSTTTQPRGARGAPGNGDFNDFIPFFLGGGQAAGAQGGIPHPFAQIFGNFMGNMGNGRMGDHVFSQEAFDQVMSQLMDQHTSGTAPGPAPQEAIAALPRRPLTEDMLDENTKQAECAICIDNVTVGEEVAFLPCNHWFHHPCVEAWLKEHDTCPVCRSGITPQDGPTNRVRAPEQAPLHNEDPAVVGRRQSGTRDHPFVVPESPSASRRRPNPRRYSSVDAAEESSNTGGGGIGSRVRSFFGGGSSNTTNEGNNSNSGQGHR